MNNDYQPIACGLYDQIELLLMRGGEIEIQQKSGVVARAQNLSLKIQNGAENLCFLDGGTEICIRLDEIDRLTSKQGCVELTN
jgi:transcriptional antiterminator Rof (Rho-off)